MRGVAVRACARVALVPGLELVNGLLLVRLHGQSWAVLACAGSGEKGVAAAGSPAASRGGLESRMAGSGLRSMVYELENVRESRLAVIPGKPWTLAA